MADPNLLDLVAALALLDTDFRQYKEPNAQKREEDGAWSSLQGKRWSGKVLADMWPEDGNGKEGSEEEHSNAFKKAAKLIESTAPDGLLGELLNTSAIVGDPKTGAPEANLFSGFVSTVLDAVTKETAGKYANQAAGSVYLYNPLFNELMMVASHGFPLVLPGSSSLLATLAKPGKPGKDGSGDVPEEGPPAAKKEREAKIALATNVRRLRYCRMLQQQLMGRRTGRDDWTRQSWKASFGGDRSRRQKVAAIDCNDVLPGVAYYSPGKGITGQLFDKKAGPELERVLLTEMRGKIEGEWDKVVKDPPLADRDSRSVFYRSKSFFIDEILLRRTVGYKHRNEMASGRQVVAGTYEPLQFPHSDFIGPFLGCVLRFGGEHLGVIKVELHRFLKTPKNGSDPFPKSHTLELDKEHDFFAAEAVVRFLLVAYALAGILYLLKHHHGVDLIDAFRLSWPEWRKVKRTGR